jgi:phospholipase C
LILLCIAGQRKLSDHASILKFIEENWRLQPLSDRSRDKLPNPIATARNPYVPLNRPAIGDLMGMFHFDRMHEEN